MTRWLRRVTAGRCRRAQANLALHPDSPAAFAWYVGWLMVAVLVDADVYEPY